MNVDAEVQLIEQTVPNTGVVQMEYAGTWGSVCPNSWDDADATVRIDIL